MSQLSSTVTFRTNRSTLLSTGKPDSANATQARRIAKDLYDAGEGRRGTDEVLFQTLLQGKTPHELGQIKQAYQDIYGKTLEEAILNEMSGSDVYLTLRLLRGDFATAERGVTTNEIALATTDSQKFDARKIAEEIYLASEGKYGTDENRLHTLLARCTKQELVAIESAYQKTYGHSLITALKSEMSGWDLRYVLVALEGRFAPEGRYVEAKAQTENVPAEFVTLGEEINAGKIILSALDQEIKRGFGDWGQDRFFMNQIRETAMAGFQASFNKAAQLYNLGRYEEAAKVYEEIKITWNEYHHLVAVHLDQPAAFSRIAWGTFFGILAFVPAGILITSILSGGGAFIPVIGVALIAICGSIGYVGLTNYAESPLNPGPSSGSGDLYANTWKSGDAERHPANFKNRSFHLERRKVAR